MAEVEGLAADGVTEVTLLGQNVNSYGRDLTLAARQAGEVQRVRPLFADLLRAVGAVPGIRRVRYTSPHPKDLRPDTVDAMAETADRVRSPPPAAPGRLGPGAGRHAPRATPPSATWRSWPPHGQAIADLAVSTDLIVGFPGETDDDFAQTLEVVAAAEYDFAYTFIFSAAAGHGGGHPGRPVRGPGRCPASGSSGCGSSWSARRWPAIGPASDASRRSWSRVRARRIGRS